MRMPRRRISSTIGSRSTFEPIGGARSFAIEDRIEALEQRQRVRCVGFGVGPDIARRHLPDVGLRLGALWQAERRGAFCSSAVVLAGQAAPGTERVETVAVAILVDDGGERADLFQALGRRHPDVGLGAQPTKIIQSVLRDDAHVGREKARKLRAPFQ